MWVTTISAEWMQLQHKSTQRAVSEHERAVAGADAAAQPPLQQPMVGGMPPGGMPPGAMHHSGGVYSSSNALSIGGQLDAQYSST